MKPTIILYNNILTNQTHITNRKWLKILHKLIYDLNHKIYRVLEKISIS